MDADQIRRLRSELTRYLKRFDDCFTRPETRGHLRTYVEGQLSDLDEKSCEPIALAAGIPPRNLQEFLATYKWDEDLTRDRLHEIVIGEHSGPNSIGVIDETSDVKKGDKTPGVKRQWCGTVGKTENCIVTVHLGYATGDFHCLLDGELFLPEDWAADRDRCREAGIPDDVEYRPKWRIALDLYDRACNNGVVFDWLACDEGYGGKPQFLRELDTRQQVFVAEVPSTFAGWIDEPGVTNRPFRRARGRGRQTPRLVAGSRPAISAKNMLKYSPALRDQPWERYYVKDGQKGPLIWEVKHVRITIKDDKGLPGMRLHLIVARNVLDPEEIKFFVSNAPPETEVQTLLLVAFSRWRVERCFEDQKQEVGLDQWEGRRWLGLKRHLIITSVSYLFLARIREKFREKKSGAYGMPGAYRCGVARAELVAERPSIGGVDRARCNTDPTLATTYRRGPQKPHEDNLEKTTENGHLSERPYPLQMA
jgi:SRSO17 transposase